MLVDTRGRCYEALVCGVPVLALGGDTVWGEVAGRIGRDPKDRLKMAMLGPNLAAHLGGKDLDQRSPGKGLDSRSPGKDALTRFRVAEAFPKCGVSLLELRLETGRTHQIRVHCAAGLGMPLIGDHV